MKKYSFIVILLVLSCKKEPKENLPYVNSCATVQETPSYVAGKWKLLNWSAVHNNLSNCTIAGGNEYDADFWGINAVLEVKSNGIVKYYKDDSLKYETIATKKSVYLDNNGERYDLNCGNLNLFISFRTLNIAEDSLQNIQIGDTVIIRNPFVDINFTNSVLYSVTYEQQYVKIE